MTTRNFEDTADNHSRSTQSLLRTMRLDVVLLSSQQDESRSMLSKLEQDWAMLQKMLEAQRTKEREENKEEAKMKKEKEQPEDNDVMVVSSRAMKQGQKKKSPQPHSRRHSSSIEWSDDQDQDTTRTLNLSDFSNQNSNKKSSATTTPLNLDRSNLDWGAPDDEIQEEDRKAERAGPLTVDTILKQADSSNGGDNDDDDVPPLKRIFGWNKRDKRPDRNSNLLLSTNSASSTATESSFFGRRTRKKQEGGGDDAASTISEGAQQQRNSFLGSLFRWDGSNRSGGGGNEMEVTPEDTPIGGGASATIAEEEKGGDDEEEHLTDEISTMQIKLRGCDAAASSLHQLVSFQKRQITDLQHERNRLKVLSEFESLQDQLELKSLQTQVVSAREERDRKKDLLEQLFIKRDLLSEKEEKLQAELEVIRMELFMLNMQSGSGDYDELEGQH